MLWAQTRLMSLMQKEAAANFNWFFGQGFCALARKSSVKEGKPLRMRARQEQTKASRKLIDLEDTICNKCIFSRALCMRAWPV